jgi:hypothetical protein
MARYRVKCKFTFYTNVTLCLSRAGKIIVWGRFKMSCWRFGAFLRRGTNISMEKNHQSDTSKFVIISKYYWKCSFWGDWLVQACSTQILFNGWASLVFPSQILIPKVSLGDRLSITGSCSGLDSEIDSSIFPPTRFFDLQTSGKGSTIVYWINRANK